MRFSCDTGGTFTDLIVEDDGGRIRLYKTSTTPEDPIEGVIAALELAAADQGQDLKQLLRRSDVFIHGTTRAINAILTGATARTALLVTEGHPDILVFREGGRIEPFNFTVPFPEPYVPRALTFEVPERIDASGQVLKSLDEDAVLAIIGKLSAKGVAAVAVCLLWSIANARHERRIGQLLNQHLPHVPFTLSHELNPTLREYRRASAAAIDASLKPLMGDYLRGLKQRLVALGFGGRVLVVTSQGGVMDADEVANAPIHSVNSGPAMAPVAGRYFARIDAEREIAIVADTGGTSYDVSLVRRGRIPWTRETWLGQPFRGHMTGFASVDLKSIGAGGGSIAWIDPGGLLHVGPQSAGSIPGPACYGQGGKHATVTDCALLLGYIDPNFFLGGAMPLYEDAARQSVEVNVAFRLGVDLDEAAAAVLSLATENMVGAIEEITIDQGIDPATAVLVGGGGAAGLNCVPIARRLGCSRVIIPEIGAGLSAAGGLLSDLSVEFSQVMFSQSSAFKYEAVNNLLGDLERKCSDFIAGPGRGSTEQSIEFSVEARYPHQIWEIEVPLRKSRIEGAADLAQLISAFHAAHREVFAIEDRESEIEAVLWRARVRCRLNENDLGRVVSNAGAIPGDRQRMVYFPGVGRAVATVRSFESLNSYEMVSGPAIVESPFTTIVVDPGAQAQRTASGSLSIFL
jgi:N-methylhydantoinase A